ncbi:hypothetical protein Tco_1454602 [Tanacetum coccineum]
MKENTSKSKNLDPILEPWIRIKAYKKKLEHINVPWENILFNYCSSEFDTIFAVCACARFQVTPKTSHLLAVKRIFRYLKGKSTLGLWYSRDSPFELVAYTDSDYAGATQDRKSTTGGCQFFGYRLISWQYLLTKGFDAGRHVKRGRETKIPQSRGPLVKVGDEAIHKELGDRMERAATTASSLEAEQESGNINRT